MWLSVGLFVVGFETGFCLVCGCLFGLFGCFVWTGMVHSMEVGSCPSPRRASQVGEGLGGAAVPALAQNRENALQISALMGIRRGPPGPGENRRNHNSPGPRPWQGC